MKKTCWVLAIFIIVTSLTPALATELKLSEWAKPYIEDIRSQNLYDLSIYKNYRENITRGEFAYLAVRLYERLRGLEVTVGNSEFEDTDDIWILKAKNAGIINGYPDNTFKPEKYIRRDELAAIFVNIFDKTNSSYVEKSNIRFNDDKKIAEWAKDYVYTAKANGIVEGVGDNEFNPGGYVTKEQSLTMISRVINSDDIKPGTLFKPVKIDMMYEQSDRIPEYDFSKLDYNNIDEVGDFSNYDMRNSEEFLLNEDLYNVSKYPPKEYLPDWFDPLRILRWGQKPLLNIDKLHFKGNTGKGVNIAYIDKPYRRTHESIKSKNIYYDLVVRDNTRYKPSSHGMAVLDIILKTAPEANIYYIGRLGGLFDQTTHAEAIYKVLKINEGLSQKDKIKVIGFSDNPDERENNLDEFLKAIEKANKKGIVVFFANNGCLSLDYYRGRNDPYNYLAFYSNPDKVHFPTSYTCPDDISDSSYFYNSLGGTSSTVPMVVGLAAMALQEDPNIDPFKIYEYMSETAYDIDGIEIINPEGFIELVKERKNDISYYYNLVYNSEVISKEDIEAINEYGKTLCDEETSINLVDVKNINNPVEIYNIMKSYHEENNLILKGIQIFGTNSEVRAFEIHDEVDMGSSGIHDLGNIITDHFYGNFNNNPDIINTELSMRSIFDEKLEIDFNLEWDLARLPLGKGEIADYYNKYLDYKSKIENNKLPLVNFSSPIFTSSRHTDNFGYFIKERLDKEFGIVSEDQYKLYGNTKGYYPINTDVLGDFTKENLKLENSKSINNFVINSHGQEGNIDGVYYSNESDESETRVSLVNNTNINNVLDNNYYNLYLWNCWGGANLGDSSIASEILDSGKAINVVASSYLTSNNGLDVYSDYKDFIGNNGISMFYSTIKGIYYNNYSWSESFNRAKRIYIKESLEDKSLEDGNYQFSLNNALTLHYFGLLEETPESIVIEDALVGPANITNNNEEIEDNENNNYHKYNNLIEFNIEEVPIIEKTQNTFAILYDDGYEYIETPYRTSFEGDEIEVSQVSSAISTNNVYFKINYNSDIYDFVYVFLQGDTPGLKKFVYNATNKGKNTLILRFDKEELLNYKAGLAINLGNRNFVFIDKEISDMLANK